MCTNSARTLCLAVLLTSIAAVLGVAVGAAPPRNEGLLQPIAFNHKRHLEEELTCTDCHKGAEDGVHATIPSVKACLLCHSEPKGSHPDEPKIRAYAEKNEAIPWVQVNRLPGHVHFPHSAHVRYAKLDCRECHGEMKDRTEPVTVSHIEGLTMDRCMECHAEKGVSDDCLRCHK